MRKVFPNQNPPYDDDRRISNARFDYKPGVIIYCDNEQDVIDALTFAQGYSGVRVRAGGHHHEGMCSGDGIAMIDVSNIATIKVDPSTQTVRLGPGAKLGDVYAAVFKEGFLFPGGACGDVHVGGLVQGGGWGLFTRGLGLTCDWVAKFHIVLPAVVNGKVEFYATWVTGASSDPNKDLYWAVLGGGGGNFGIPIEFVFNIVPFKYSPGPGQKHVTQFSANFSDRSRVDDVINGWMSSFPNADERLTTFCRVITRGSENLGDQPSLIFGNFVGEEGELRSILGKLLPLGGVVEYKSIAVWPPSSAPPTKIFSHPHYQAGPPGGLTDTCASGAYYRHKVSSAYPRQDITPNPPYPPYLGPDAMKVILKYINDEPPLGGSRRYLSLHSLGGEVVANPQREQWNCFAYRHKPFLMQYQAWWDSKDLDTKNLDWVKNFRDEMRPFVEGSFINFPDRDLIDTKDKFTLMAPFYGKHFAKLIAVKVQYDQMGVFDFPMGIPRP